MKLSFVIPQAEAYGEADPENVVELAKELFCDEHGKFDAENVYVGNIIPMNTPEGQTLYGMVKGVTATMVNLDFNPPLAGYDLHFVGEVLEGREATAKEVEGFINFLAGETGCGGSCGGDGCQGGGCGSCGGC